MQPLEKPGANDTKYFMLKTGKAVGDSFGIEAGEGPQPVGSIEVDNKHVDNAVAFGLQLEAAFHLQRRTKKHGQGRGLAHEARHGRGIAVLGQDVIDGRPQPDDSAAHIEGLDGERKNKIVVAEVGQDALGHRNHLP